MPISNRYNVNYQLSMFDMFDNLFTQNNQIPEEEEISVNYLDREDKILTLAREKCERTLSSFHFSELEEKIYSVKLDMTDDLKTIISKLARVFRRYIGELTEEKKQELKNLIPYEFDLEYADKEARSHFWHMLKQPDEQLLCLSLREKGYSEFVVYGTMKKSHTQGKSNVLFKDEQYPHAADIAKMLAWMFLLSSINKEIHLQTKLCQIMERKLGDAKAYCLAGSDNICSYIGKNIRNKEQPMENLTLYINPTLKDTSVDKLLRQFYPNASVLYAVSTTRQTDIPYYEAYDYNPVIKHLPFEVLNEILPYHAFLVTYKRRRCLDYWPLPTVEKSDFALRTFLEEATRHLWEIKGNELTFTKELVSSKSDYAKSFQTKKNIPQKVLNAMASSRFNDYFGYVEFDEDVELGAVEEIQKEFQAFMNSYFPALDVSDNALRIRKLGNHKALGLYYPAVKCLCVDINSPNSFLHEFGHLLDYSMDSASLSDDFVWILSEYKHRLLSLCEKDSTLHGKLSKTGKYNLQYYLKPTEVFARSFELYCKHTLQVNNSLLNPVGYAYPEDNGYIRLISNYFNHLFRKEDLT